MAVAVAVVVHGGFVSDKIRRYCRERERECVGDVLVVFVRPKRREEQWWCCCCWCIVLYYQCGVGVVTSVDQSIAVAFEDGTVKIQKENTIMNEAMKEPKKKGNTTPKKKNK